MLKLHAFVASCRMSGPNASKHKRVYIQLQPLSERNKPEASYCTYTRRMINGVSFEFNEYIRMPYPLKTPLTDLVVCCRSLKFGKRTDSERGLLLASDERVFSREDKLIGKAVISSQHFRRGLPIGFFNERIKNMRGDAIGIVTIRLQVQYPNSAVLPPTLQSSKFLRKYSGLDQHKYNPIKPLLLLSLTQIRQQYGRLANLFDAKVSRKIRVILSWTTVDGIKRSYEIGPPTYNAKAKKLYWSSQNSLWLDLDMKSIHFQIIRSGIVVRKMCGEIHLKTNVLRKGTKCIQWYPIHPQIMIKQKRNELNSLGVLGVVLQVQYYHSVIIPPECNENLLLKHYGSILDLDKLSTTEIQRYRYGISPFHETNHAQSFRSVHGNSPVRSSNRRKLANSNVHASPSIQLQSRSTGKHANLEAPLPPPRPSIGRTTSAEGKKLLLQAGDDNSQSSHRVSSTKTVTNFSEQRLKKRPTSIRRRSPKFNNFII